MDEYTYNTIGQAATAEFKDRGSRFLAFAYPIRTLEEFKVRLQEIKKQHPKASHHCFAYRLGTDHLQFRVNDGGEPSGSAGRPILGQIDRLGITDVLVIVIRYFGGTLLGIPGLINAYKTTAALTLQMTPVITQNIEHHFQLDFDYTTMHIVMQTIRRYHCTVYHQDSTLFCKMEIGIPVVHKQDCLNKLNEIPGLEISEKSQNNS